MRLLHARDDSHGCRVLERHPSPHRKEITAAISGNLCRCTGYRKILDAIEAVSPKALKPGITEGSIKPGITEGPVKPVSAPLPLSSSEDDRPVFLPETLEALFEFFSYHPDARVFSGGTDLLVWIRNRGINPPALIGLQRIPALSGIIQTGDGVRIGAGTSHAAILENFLIGHWFPVLTQAIRSLGSPISAAWERSAAISLPLLPPETPCRRFMSSASRSNFYRPGEPAGCRFPPSSPGPENGVKAGGNSFRRFDFKTNGDNVSAF